MILDTNVLIRLERELRKGEAGPATQFLENLPQRLQLTCPFIFVAGHHPSTDGLGVGGVRGVADRQHTRGSQKPPMPDGWTKRIRRVRDHSII